jgi:diguanylate cyclase (GGDEF)-like protein
MLHKRLTLQMAALGAGALLAGAFTAWSALNLYRSNTALREVGELRLTAQQLEIGVHERVFALTGFLRDGDEARMEQTLSDAHRAAQALQRLEQASSVPDAHALAALKRQHAQHEAGVVDLVAIGRRMHALIGEAIQASERLDRLLSEARIPRETQLAPRRLHAVSKMEIKLAKLMRELGMFLRTSDRSHIGDAQRVAALYGQWEASFQELAQGAAERQWLLEVKREAAQFTQDVQSLFALASRKDAAMEQLESSEAALDRILDETIGAQFDARHGQALRQQAWARAFALGSVALLLLLIASSIVSMQATRRRLRSGLAPLLELAQRIGAGDLTSAVQVEPAGDEFAQVAQAFARMREKMRDNLVSLHSLNAILDQLGGLRVQAGADGSIRDVSSAALRALGYRTDEVEGAPLALLLGQDMDFPTLRELTRQGLLQEQTWSWRRADASTLPVVMSGLLVNEELVLLYGNPADTMADGLLSKIGEGLVLLDAAGSIRQANPAAVAMLGADAATLSRCTLAQALERVRCDRAIGAAFAAELVDEPHGAELRLQGPDQDVRFVHVKASRLPVLAGQPELLALTLTDSTQLHRAQDEVRRLAYVDPLTGLANRARFAQALDDAIKVARRRGETLALLFIDLDGFKDVNDSLGHDQGDRLLQEVGARLSREVREVDLVARIGGDEFCLVLSHLQDAPGALEVAQRCLRALAPACTLAGGNVFPQASIGISLYPRDATHAGGLVKAADTAMYAAKQRGKNTCALYEAGMADAVEQRLALEASLRGAIERGELELRYQPKVSLVSGAMQGVEALVRWVRPGIGTVPPDEFIGVAERIGMIGALGEWVLESACRQAVAWRSAGLPGLGMAVNISASHFEAPDFVAGVARLVQAHAMPPGSLEIEITESITRNPGRHAQVCRALQRIGVRVAIDDFGTGYSSLSVLKNMQVDTLKLDRQFVHDMTNDESSAVMVGTIIGLATGLNLSIVAEGVETIAQVQVLCGLGCPLAQGYFFSPPVLPEQIPALARSSFLLRRPGPEIEFQPEAGEMVQG